MDLDTFFKTPLDYINEIDEKFYVAYLNKKITTDDYLRIKNEIKTVRKEITTFYDRID